MDNFSQSKLSLIEQGHVDLIYRISCSPDNIHIATAGSDKTVKIWTLDDLKLVKTLRGHTDMVKSVAYSKIDNILISGSRDTSIRAWDTIKFSCLKTLEGHNKQVNSVSFSQNYDKIISGSWDKTIKIWSCETYECLSTLKVGGSVMEAFFYTQDSQILYCTWSNLLNQWKIKNQFEENFGQDNFHLKDILCLEISESNNKIITGSEDNTIKVWDFTSQKCLKTLDEHTNWIWDIAISNNQKLFASVSGDRTVKIWDIDSYKCLGTLKGHEYCIQGVSFSNDDQKLISSDEKGKLIVLNIKTQQIISRVKDHTGKILMIKLSLDKKKIISCSEDQTIKVWDIRTNQVIADLNDGEDTLKSIQLTQQENIILSFSDTTCKLWNLITKECIRKIEYTIRKITCLTISRDLKYLIIGDSSGKIIKFDFLSKQEVNSIEGHQGEITTIETFPNEQKFISGGKDCAIKIWDAQSFKCVKIFKGQQSIDQLHFLSNGRILLSKYQNEIRAWNIKTFNCLKIIKNTEKMISVSPQTNTIAFYSKVQNGEIEIVKNCLSKSEKFSITDFSLKELDICNDYFVATNRYEIMHGGISNLLKEKERDLFSNV